jgi:hexosaminidase
VKIDKLLFSWQNLESGISLARQGFKVVLCPAELIYFDMAQSRNYAIEEQTGQQLFHLKKL